MGDEGAGAGVVVAGHGFDVAALRDARVRAPRPGPASPARRPARSRPRRSPPALAGRRPASCSSASTRLGRRVVGPVGVEAVGDRAADRAGQRGRRGSRRCRCGGRCRRRSGRGRRTSAAPFLASGASSCASIRSHQSANHSVNSMPPRSTISGNGSCLAAAHRLHGAQAARGRRGGSPASHAGSRPPPPRQRVGEEQLQQPFLAHLKGLGGWRSHAFSSSSPSAVIA